MDVVQLQLFLLVFPGQPFMMDLQLLHLLQDPSRQPYCPVLLSPAHFFLPGPERVGKLYQELESKFIFI